MKNLLIVFIIGFVIIQLHVNYEEIHFVIEGNKMMDLLIFLICCVMVFLTGLYCGYSYTDKHRI